MKHVLSIILLTVISWSVAAQDTLPPAPIVVVGPTTPIPKESWVLIPVSNLEEPEFLASSITVVPKDGTIAFRVYGAPAVFFYSAKPGKYTVTVGRNVQHAEWQRSLSLASTQQKEAGLSVDFQARLEKYISDAAAAFPSRGGSCVVEVAGEIPFPPTDPPKPPLPPTTKVDRVTYVYEKDLTAIPRPVEFALQRLNKESGNSIMATLFEEDSTVDGAPNGRTPTQYVVALKAARDAGLPALVVQAGEVVVRVIKAPTTETAVMEAAK